MRQIKEADYGLKKKERGREILYRDEKEGVRNKGGGLEVKGARKRGLSRD